MEGRTANNGAVTIGVGVPDWLKHLAAGGPTAILLGAVIFWTGTVAWPQIREDQMKIITEFQKATTQIEYRIGTLEAAERQRVKLEWVKLLVDNGYSVEDAQGEAERIVGASLQNQ